MNRNSSTDSRRAPPARAPCRLSRPAFACRGRAQHEHTGAGQRAEDARRTRCAMTIFMRGDYAAGAAARMTASTAPTLSATLHRAAGRPCSALRVTARLGVWQLDRAAQKIALQRRIDAARQRCRRLPAADARAHGRRRGARSTTARVRLRGRWLRRAHRVPRQPADERPARLLRRHAAELAQGRRGARAARLGAARPAGPRTRCRRCPRRQARSRCDGRIAPPPARLYEFAAGGAGRDPAESRPRRLRARNRAWRCGRCRCCRTTPCAADDGLLREWPRARGRRAQAPRLCLPVVRAVCADRRSVCLVPTPPTPAPPPLRAEPLQLHRAHACRRRRWTTTHAAHARAAA